MGTRDAKRLKRVFRAVVYAGKPHHHADPRRLWIKEIAGHLKHGLPLQFLTTARVDGRGTHAVIGLPAEVPADTGADHCRG
jgi:hypothetical protein